MLKFKVVEASNKDELQGAVQEYLNNGWLFMGAGDIHVTHVRAGELRYTVAMLKQIEKEG